MPRLDVPRFRLLAPASLAGLSLFLNACAGASSGPPTPTPDALQVLEKLRRELIPSEGAHTGYGPTFSTEGYETLRRWNASLRPLPSWSADYERLDIRLPCCEARHPYRDESQNCGCGHHQALYGLAKRLLHDGEPRSHAQAEIARWRAFMFPSETLQAEMERRALEDPAIREALDELREQGIC